jgi:Secretion system C-terminal sorting domain/Photosynthesis system II assembly factor YCF48
MRKVIYLLILFITASLYSQTFLWEEQNSGTSTPLNSVSAYNNNYVWICGDDDLVLRTTNGGLNWADVSGNIFTGIDMVSILAINENTAIALGYCGTSCIWKTTNGGLNWIEPLVLQGNGHFRSVKNKSSNPNECFIVGDPVAGRWSLWKSTDAGTTWDSAGICLMQMGSGTGFDNCLSVIESKVWFSTYTSGNSLMYYSSNFGANWTYYNIPEPCITAIWVNNFGNDAEQLAGGINLKYSTNSGTNWSSLLAPGAGGFNGFTTYGQITGNDNYNGGMFYIRYDPKIYWSSSNLQNFNAIHTAPAGPYKCISKSVPNIWAVRHNGGISRCVVYVGVQNVSSEIPAYYKLYQNYPNPFNPVTTIEYSIHDDGNVELKVFNVLGETIEVPVNQFQRAGTYKIAFDGKNLPSGVYTYRISSGSYTETKKMILVK